jgi:hypothetical protein
MEPITFAEANAIYGAADCGSLPVENDGIQLVSCWRLSWRDRIAAVLFGRVWLCIRGQSQPPVWLTCERDCHIQPPPLPEPEETT